MSSPNGDIRRHVKNFTFHTNVLFTHTTIQSVQGNENFIFLLFSLFPKFKNQILTLRTFLTGNRTFRWAESVIDLIPVKSVTNFNDHSVTMKKNRNNNNHNNNLRTNKNDNNSLVLYNTLKHSSIGTIGFHFEILNHANIFFKKHHWILRDENKKLALTCYQNNVSFEMNDSSERWKENHLVACPVEIINADWMYYIDWYSRESHSSGPLKRTYIYSVIRITLLSR